MTVASETSIVTEGALTLEKSLRVNVPTEIPCTKLLRSSVELVDVRPEVTTKLAIAVLSMVSPIASLVTSRPSAMTRTDAVW